MSKSAVAIHAQRRTLPGKKKGSWFPEPSLAFFQLGVGRRRKTVSPFKLTVTSVSHIVLKATPAMHKPFTLTKFTVFPGEENELPLLSITTRKRRDFLPVEPSN